MNAIPTDIFIPEPLNWQKAYQDVSEWRGRCQDQFAKAEGRVSDTLVALKKVKAGKVKVTLPLLVGQRFDLLTRILKSDERWVECSQSAVRALERYQQHSLHRQALSHGEVHLAFDQQAKWVVLLKYTKLEENKHRAIRYGFEQGSAKALYTRLQSDTKKLVSALDQINKSIELSLSDITPSAPAAPASR